METKLLKRICPFCFLEFATLRIIRSYTWRKHKIQLDYRNKTSNSKPENTFHFSFKKAKQYPNVIFLSSCPSCPSVYKMREELLSHVNDKHILKRGDIPKEQINQDKDENKITPFNLSINHQSNEQCKNESAYKKTNKIQSQPILQEKDNDFENRWMVNRDNISNRCKF
ncbi:unnamed protein product [Cunninghamella blakesleeana]